LQIAHTADVVTHGKVGNAVIEAVNGEVTALGIFFNRAKDVVAQQHAVLAALGDGAIGLLIVMMTTEGRHFDNLRPEHHVREAETATHQAAVAEELAHLIRRGVGSDIKIFWFFAQQQVAHPAAYQVCFIARFIQTIEHFERIFADIFAGNSVLLTRNNRHLRFGHCLNGHALFAA